MHSVIVTSVNVVRYARYVKSEQWKVHVFKELNHNYQSLSGNDVTLRVEDFVEVEYNGERYAREVKLIEEDVCRFLYYTGTLLKTGCAPPLFNTNIPMCSENCAHLNL